MDYQVQERQYEPVIDYRDELVVPIREEYKYEGQANKEENSYLRKDYNNMKIMYDQLIRVFKDINTGQLYIESNTLFKLRGAKEDNEIINKYSTGLVPITLELLNKIIKEYEERFEVHVDIEVVPIELDKSHIYNNVEDFVKGNNIEKNNHNKDLENMFNKDYDNNNIKDHIYNK